MLMPSPAVQSGTLNRMDVHAQKHYVGRRGVTEIRGHFRGNYLFLEVVKEETGGLIGKMFKIGSVRGIGRLARLEYVGRNRWKFLIYKPEKKMYGPYPRFREGTIEQCLDAVAKVYFK